jgi:addiction module HigA family antidote
MNPRSVPFRPNYTIHPGETLAETMEALGMSPEDLAQRGGIPLAHIHDLLAKRASITPVVATALELVLQVPANFWMTSQRNYDAAKGCASGSY